MTDDGLSRALRLVLVTPGDRSPQDTLELVRQALGGGVTAVLLREPRLAHEQQEQLARELVAATASHDAVLIVSREVELARRVGAFGVHCGHDGPGVASVRAAGLVAGRSAHWPLDREDHEADYLTLSPFAPTQRSRPRPLLTEEQIGAVLSRPGAGPVVALGGIDGGLVAALPAGLAGVAVIRALSEAPDPGQVARALRAAVEERWPSGAPLA